MSNIEEDIKEIRESIEEAYRSYDYDLDYSPFSKGIAEILERILSERESDKKRIKELEQENKTLKNFTSAIFNGNIKKEYIPKQKVKDEIEELKKHYNTDNNIRIYTLKDSYELQATILEELLEDK